MPNACNLHGHSRVGSALNGRDGSTTRHHVQVGQNPERSFREHAGHVAEKIVYGVVLGIVTASLLAGIVLGRSMWPASEVP